MKKISLLALCLLAVLIGCKTDASPSDDENPAAKKYTVNFSANPEQGGTVTAALKDGKPVNNGDKIVSGTEIVFTAMPKDGYEIGDWNGITDLTVSIDKKTATLTLKGDANVTVTFNKKAPAPSAKQYTVTFTVNPQQGGTVTAKTKDGKPVTSGEKVDENTEVTFTATPNDGYYLKNWSGADILNAGTDTLTVTQDATVTAHFSELVESKNWEAEGEIKDSNGKLHNVKMTINDEGKYFTVFDGSSQGVVRQMEYNTGDDFIKIYFGNSAKTLKFLSKPQNLPSDWKIKFEDEMIFEDDEHALHIAKNTEATIKVTYNNNNEQGKENGLFIK